MKTILITGGSGFIGRNIVEQMSEKYNILAPSHTELELLDEVQVSDYLLSNKIDVVIHSATKPGHRNANDLSNLVYINTRMFFNLARNYHLFSKMLFLGSGAVYDARNYKPKMKEDYFDKYVPADEHGFSKYICAKYIEKSQNIKELRIFGVFGKYEDYAIRFISNVICKTLNDLPITCRQNKKFDYLYIDDLVTILEFFIENETKEKVFNITPNESIELEEIIQKILKISGKKLPVYIAEEGIGDEYSGDNNRLTNEMPNLNLTSIDGSIRQLYDWYEHNQELINKNLLLVDK